MMQLPALVLGTVLSLVLASQSHAPSERRAGPGADFSLEYGEGCTGLEPNECCEQHLESASFRAQGDHPARLVKGLIHLACSDKRRVMAPQACRSIAALRGFHHRDVDAICNPAAAECGAGQLCNQCVTELQKLGYRGAHHVCRSLTYVKRP